MDGRICCWMEGNEWIWMEGSFGSWHEFPNNRQFLQSQIIQLKIVFVNFLGKLDLKKRKKN
jgi:hypothetical protein